MAKFFLKSGDFVWNSGIFIWNAKAIMQALEQYLPEINTIFKEGTSFYNTIKKRNSSAQLMHIALIFSIDYGVMEKAKNVYVLGAEFGWSDLGTSALLYMISYHSDQQANAVVGLHVMLEQNV